MKDRDPDEGVSDIAYEKGYFFLRKIEEAVGRERFDGFVKKYFATFAFKSMDTEYFVTYLTKELPEAAQFIQPWIYSTGIPADIIKIKPERFNKVDNVLADWLKGKKAIGLDVKEWTSQEWLHFLRSLSKKLNPQQMQELDEAFHFTDSGNAEILTEWLSLVLPNGYEKAYNATENFLVNAGRRKFLMPIYKALLQTEDGKKLAGEIYKKARPNYHSVSYNSLDILLKGILEN